VFPDVVCVDVSAALRLLVAGSDDGVVAVWSLVDKQLVHALQGHTGQSDRTLKPHQCKDGGGNSSISR